MLLGWAEVEGSRKAAIHSISEHVCCGVARAHASIPVINLTQRKARRFFFFYSFVQLILHLYILFLLILHFELYHSLYLPFTLLKASVLSLWATVCTRFCLQSIVYACNEIESLQFENFRCVCMCLWACLPVCIWILCVCIYSYPLIVTVFINSLGLMCNSVTPAVLLARLPCSLDTSGPNYQADDLTSNTKTETTHWHIVTSDFREDLFEPEVMLHSTSLFHLVGLPLSMSKNCVDPRLFKSMILNLKMRV